MYARSISLFYIFILSYFLDIASGSSAVVKGIIITAKTVSRAEDTAVRGLDDASVFSVYKGSVNQALSWDLSRLPNSLKEVKIRHLESRSIPHSTLSYLDMTKSSFFLSRVMGLKIMLDLH